MKTAWSILGITAMFALLLVVPATAEMASLNDSDLSGITGKADNTMTLVGSVSVTAEGDNSANIQVGNYQWSDFHGGDVSNQKAANYFDSGPLCACTAGAAGASNQVQQNVVAEINAITWGATGNGNFIAGDLANANSFTNMDYATMALGGF